MEITLPGRVLIAAPVLSGCSFVRTKLRCDWMHCCLSLWNNCAQETKVTLCWYGCYSLKKQLMPTVPAYPFHNLTLPHSLLCKECLATWQRCWVLHPKASESCQASPSRASRRWRDLEREFRPLPHKLEEGDATIGTTNSAATTSGTPTVLQQHQGLPTLHESTSDDPEEWLGQLEFIRTFNHQDDKEAFST